MELNEGEKRVLVFYMANTNLGGVKGADVFDSFVQIKIPDYDDMSEDSQDNAIGKLVHELHTVDEIFLEFKDHHYDMTGCNIRIVCDRFRDDGSTDE